MAHVLIVDDDPIIAEFASEILISAGHACGWVTDGQEAMDLLKWRRPDLMLLDQDMPDMTGAQVLRKLRNSPEHYDLPVIMFTGITGHQDEQSAFYNGAQDYVRKPFDPQFLLMKINGILKTRATHPQHRSLEELMSQENNPQRRADGSTRYLA